LETDHWALSKVEYITKCIRTVQEVMSKKKS